MKNNHLFVTHYALIKTSTLCVLIFYVLIWWSHKCNAYKKYTNTTHTCCTKVTEHPWLAEECKPDQWKCHNNICINIDFLCDGQVDCDDQSDEDEFVCRRGNFWSFYIFPQIHNLIIITRQVWLYIYYYKTYISFICSINLC